MDVEQMPAHYQMPPGVEVRKHKLKGQVGFVLVGMSSNDNAGISSVVYFI